MPSCVDGAMGPVERLLFRGAGAGAGNDPASDELEESEERLLL
jgi:hypothetical protein